MNNIQIVSHITDSYTDTRRKNLCSHTVAYFHFACYDGGRDYHGRLAIRLKIENALVYTPENRFEQKPLSWQGEFITADGAESAVLDGSGCFLIPGLIDLHLHGCMGHDFCDGTPQALHAIAQYEAENGVTGFCPATMSLPQEELVRILGNAARCISDWPTDSAQLLGVYLEGPFLSPAKKGAQRGDALRNPDVGLFHQLQAAAGGLIRFAAIAPELPGAAAFIAELKDKMVLSLAHTGADYAQTKAALEAGVCHVTHLYNAMTPFSHREPGVVGAVWEDSRCRAELICDGIHVHPAAVRLAFRLLGEERIFLVSDSMEAAGMQDGDYSLGGQAVRVCEGHAALADGTIAGSAANLMDCLRTAVLEMDIPLVNAVRCACVNPAVELGVYDMCGSLAPGKRADFVLLEQGSLRIRAVYLGGKRIR